ncbi:MAG: helix-turn-helix domain-containing protein [Caldilineaceae bacterium]
MQQPLTPTENRLVAYLLAKNERPATPKELREAIWGDEKSLAVVEKTINRLRKKIEPEPDRPRYLRNEYGEGYTLVLSPGD